MTRILVSDCGGYTAEKSGTWYVLRTTDGQFVCRTTYWANRSTSSRIAFECGTVDVRATFSYPRYPRWFKRRWIECFDIDIAAAAELIESKGGVVLVAFKPGFCVWNHLGFWATPNVSRDIDESLSLKGLEFFGPSGKRSRGGFNIECPEPARYGEIVSILEAA